MTMQGKVAIVTGAASGIGRTTARLLASEGASVVVADLDEPRAKSVAREIESEGGAALALQVDVSSEEAIRAMIATTLVTYGGLDILHNNAAALGPASPGRDMDIASMDVDVWDRTMAVNLRGVMLGCKHAIPAMLERGGGAIVNTTSGSAQRGDLSIPAYAVSKGGVDTLTKYVAAQYGKKGIRCNAIAPGLILTHGVENFGGEAYVQMLEEHHLTPRVGRPEDIAHAVLYLVSDGAEFVTGQILNVDGGILSHAPPFADIRRMAR
jgi:NAD(P)-dependent dehydrogenase (short-subunit alcohol dehydrogenase family)